MLSGDTACLHLRHEFDVGTRFYYHSPCLPPCSYGAFADIAVSKNLTNAAYRAVMLNPNMVNANLRCPSLADFCVK